MRGNFSRFGFLAGILNIYIMISSANWLSDTANAWDIWIAPQTGARWIKRRQSERLGALLEFARKHSRFYRRLYDRLPVATTDLMSLPPVSRQVLMGAFDDWVTDRDVSRDQVDAFLGDRRLIGELFKGRYAVWKSSGTSGRPGVFLHDRHALAIYDMLLAQRGWAKFPFGDAARDLWGRPWRMACLTANEDHFAGISSWRRIAVKYPLYGALMRDFSVLTPINQLVEALNDWQPLQLVAYPSILALLAKEQGGGRLRIAPAVIVAGGEYIDACQHDLIEKAFGCPMRCVYACSECDYIAFECANRNLHVNADWIILEPVDADYHPVDPGETSRSVLVTNLANRIQPIVRYELDDSVTILPEPCPCGNPLPAIRVEGRRDEIMVFQARDGTAVTILPMAITTVIDVVPGICRFQITRVGENALRVACEFANPHDAPAVARTVRSRLMDFLAAHNLKDIRITVDDRPPVTDPVSGKFRQVISMIDNG